MITNQMDRENVIKELESLRDICNAKSNMAIGKGKVAWAGYANAAEDAIAILKEQQEEIENLKQACQSMKEGVCLIKKKDECVENLEHQYGCFELKSKTAIYFTEDQFDLILKWMESTGSETIQDAIIQAIYRASIQGKLSLFNEHKGTWIDNATGR